LKDVSATTAQNVFVGEEKQTQGCQRKRKQVSWEMQPKKKERSVGEFTCSFVWADSHFKFFGCGFSVLNDEDRTSTPEPKTKCHELKTFEEL